MENLQRPVGVMGAGSFGTVMSNLLAQNSDVLLFAHRAETYNEMVKTRKRRGYDFHNRVSFTNDMEELCNRCRLIFPIIPAKSFEDAIKNAAPFLTPEHILIHGTKGLSEKRMSKLQAILDNGKVFHPDCIRTMSQIIVEESSVRRVGCISGPNLAREIAHGLPAATVVASRFDEVIDAGLKILRSPKFKVYKSHNLRGVELSGVLKNIMAIASGILHNLDTPQEEVGLGENASAFLITRGFGEIIKIGLVLGVNFTVFMGVAGIGDLIATCSSPQSRNFTVGKYLAQGLKLEQIREKMEEVAEGVNTIKLANQIVDYYGIAKETPIVKELHALLYEDKNIEAVVKHLLEVPREWDADFTHSALFAKAAKKFA